LGSHAYPVPVSHLVPAAAPDKHRLDAAAPEAHPPAPPASGPAAQDGGMDACSPFMQAPL